MSVADRYVQSIDHTQAQQYEQCQYPQHPQHTLEPVVEFGATVPTVLGELTQCCEAPELVVTGLGLACDRCGAHWDGATTL